MTVLAALDMVHEETPYRVFSVRVFNDSKRFEFLKGALVTLARRHQQDWGDLSDDETLREFGLVANPGHLYLYGPWRLVDEHALRSKPLTRADEKNLARLVCHPSLTDMQSIIAHMLACGIKLEQEAISWNKLVPGS